MKKNPHMALIAIDPPRKHPHRRWKCKFCRVEGLYEEVRSVACSYVHPPCKVCGQTPECAIDCAGIAAALGAPGVEVVGTEKLKLPET